jgi:acetyltransferase-like isoleucine patch superfamily enzyme
MLRRIKALLLVLGDLVFNAIIPSSRCARLRRAIYVRRLERRDGPAAAAEHARDLGVTVGEHCRFYGVEWGPEPFLIEIGDDVLIAEQARLLTHDSGVYVFRHEVQDIVNNYGRIKIGDNCFIGFRATILPNVQLGKNCIVAAGAVVADSFPDDCVIMGNPAKVVFMNSMYRKMKLASELTVRHTISFPEFDFLPIETRRQIILDQIGDIPIRQPRTGGVRGTEDGADVRVRDVALKARPSETERDQT